MSCNNSGVPFNALLREYSEENDIYGETAFIDAVIHKYRFPGPHGGSNLMTEDLFDLSVDNLDLIYKALTKEKREQESCDSLINPVKVDPALNNKIAIVRAVARYLRAKTAKADSDREAKNLMQWALREKNKKQRENVTMEQLDAIIQSGGTVNPFNEKPTSADTAPDTTEE